MKEDCYRDETYSYSSLFVHKRCVRSSPKSLLSLLLIVCGDIESCPGPSLLGKCNGCNKYIKKKQATITCERCLNVFHLTCISSDKDVCLQCDTHNVSETFSNADHENPNADLIEMLRFKGLKNFHQNIRGLFGKIAEISRFLNTYKDVHILSLSETHLDSSTPDDLLKIPGYTFIKRNRTNGSHGGVGVYIKDNVPYIRRNDLEAGNLECIWLEILFPKTKGLLIGIFYRPPYGSKYLRNDFDDELDNLLQSVITENKECMIMGDFNCNYRKRPIVQA